MIEPTAPIEIPAQPAKVADGLWITNLVILAPEITQPIRVVAQICPFVSSTGEIFKDQVKFLRIDDLFALAATNQDIATAVNALFTALQGQIQAQQLF